MEIIETGILAALIMTLTQIMTRFFPGANRMNMTLIMAVVVGAIAVFWYEGIGFLQVIVALALEVLTYDVATKTIAPMGRNIIGGGGGAARPRR